MARMRRNVLGSLVFIWLVASSEAALPRSHQGPRKESTSGRNNLLNTPSGKSEVSPSVSDVPATYECLYVSPDLPICDIERMEDSTEDITHSTADYHRETKASAENFGKDRRPPTRARRDVVDGMKAASQDSPGRQIIVYTIEGCLPPSLPFKMPSCRQKGPRDKILEVRKLYPFTVKGLTRPPLIFPEFNFDRWTRMMKRLRSHSLNDSDGKTQPIIGSTGKASGQTRTHSMTAAAAPARQPAMPNRTSTAKLQGSSLTKEADIHKQDKSTKKPKPNERKIKVDESLSPIRSKKLPARKNSSSTLDSQKAVGFDDLRLKQRTESFPRKTSNEQEYRKKKLEAQHSPNEFRILQKSWGTNTDRSLGEEKSLMVNHWKKEIEWSDEPEMIKPKFHPLIGTRPNAYKSVTFDHSSNDLVDSHPNQLLKTPRKIITGKYNDRNIELGNAVFNVNEFSENSRNRRQVRFPDEVSPQMIVSETKTSGHVGKSFLNRHRTSRETKNSRDNVLHISDKSDRSSNYKSSGFPLDNRQAVGEIQDHSENKQSEINNSNTQINHQLNSEALQAGNNNNKIYNMKGDLQKGWDEKSPIRKKYSDTLDVTLKHNKRIHRD